MQTKKTPFFFIALFIAGFGAACSGILGGGSAVPIGELPMYPEAVELQEGESAIGDILAQNEQQDAAIREAAGFGGSTEQRGFRLPANATWDDVNSYYAKELEAAGWSSGLGGIAGGFIDVNEVMGAANQGNDLFQTAIWSKDKQTLTLVMMTDPTDEQVKELIVSLSTQ